MLLSHSLIFAFFRRIITKSKKFVKIINNMLLKNAKRVIMCMIMWSLMRRLGD